MSLYTSLTRVVLTTATALAVVLPFATTALAQGSAPRARAWELRLPSGAFVPTGQHRSAVDDAPTSAVQLSWVVRPRLAITGTFSWARSRDIATVSSPRLDVFTSDVGAEFRGAEWFSGSAVTVMPFVGVGGGARSYNYRKLDVDATNNLAAYAAAGGELGMGRIALRLEVRDYATGFRPLIGDGRSVARNDVTAMFALAFNRKRAAQE